jgi:hypothetical protein
VGMPWCASGNALAPKAISGVAGVAAAADRADHEDDELHALALVLQVGAQRPTRRARARAAPLLRLRKDRRTPRGVQPAATPRGDATRRRHAATPRRDATPRRHAATPRGDATWPQLVDAQLRAAQGAHHPAAQVHRSMARPAYPSSCARVYACVHMRVHVRLLVHVSVCMRACLHCAGDVHVPRRGRAWTNVAAPSAP